ncbi:MAG: hypothetical protein H0V51_25450 [Chloroflexi bacterium]|nr:hypothetical protein [Chloroflexota bacterium]
MLGIAGDDTAEAPTAAERHGRPRLVLRHWVEDQAAYFARATRRDDRRRRRQTRMAQVFFLGGLGLATFAALLSIVPRPSRDILGLLIAIGSLASVSAALLRNYGQTLALAEHTKQYERMSRLFADAREQLEAAIDGGDDARARTLIEELGKEALAENGDWVLLHRERRIEVPDAR